MASDQIEYCGNCPYYKECHKDGTPKKCKVK